MADPNNLKELNEFIEWAKRDDLGCVFGTRLAKQLDRTRWNGFVFKERVGDSLAKLLDTVAPEYAAQGPELFQAVLPNVHRAEEVVDLLRLLCQMPNWYAYEVKWKPESEADKVPKAILVALRWKLPDRQHVSWSLGFGKWRELPWTRRGAPYTSLIMRVSPPKQEVGIDAPPEVAREFDLTPVHLAHMAAGVSKQKYGELWSATSKLKRKIVEPDMLPAAKAKVTFSFALELREKLRFLLNYDDVIGSQKEAAVPAPQKSG